MPKPDPTPEPAPIERPLCRSETKAGKPCSNKALPGSAFCGAHGGGKRRPGAPSKLDDALINTLVEIVERGVSYAVAAQSVGINAATFRDWRDKGDRDLTDGKTATLYAQLAVRLIRANAEAERRLVEVIASHGPVDWRAAAHLLACRFPSRWAKRDKAMDDEIAERAQPRTVTPVESKRDSILGILATSMKPPAGADQQPVP